MTDPADDPAATPTASHQISCTLADRATCEVSCFGQGMPFLPSRFQSCGRCIIGLVFAAESLLDEPAAVLQEVVANLAASEGEVVKGIEINIRGDLGNDTRAMSACNIPCESGVKVELTDSNLKQRKSH